MASSETPAPEHEKVVEAPTHEPEKVVEKAAPPPEVKTPVAHAPPSNYFGLADVVLRFLLFASSLVAVVLFVTSKQSKKIPIPFPPFVTSRSAKFEDSPAFIYFVVALSVSGLYSLITTLASFYAILKPGCCAKVLSHFIILDVLLFGIVSSATGTAAGVAYIGLKGNSHVGWNKVCNVFDDFCKHIGASVAISLFGSVVLTLLVLLSIYSLSKKIPK